MNDEFWALIPGCERLMFYINRGNEVFMIQTRERERRLKMAKTKSDVIYGQSLIISGIFYFIKLTVTQIFEHTNMFG